MTEATPKKKMTLERLARMTANQFARVDERFEAVDKRFDAIDTRFDKIDGRFKTILDIVVDIPSKKAFQRLENKRIPATFEFAAVPQLRHEAREKLNRIRPTSLGQASRISGITPADLAVLLFYLE